MSEELSSLTAILKDHSSNKQSLVSMTEFLKEKARIDRTYSRALKKLLSCSLFECTSQSLQLLKQMYLKVSESTLESSSQLYELCSKVKNSIDKHAEMIKESKTRTSPLDIKKLKSLKNKEKTSSPLLVENEQSYKDKFPGLLLSFSMIESLRKEQLKESLNSLLEIENVQMSKAINALKSCIIANEGMITTPKEGKVPLSRTPSVLYPSIEMTSFPNAEHIKIMVNSCWEGRELRDSEYEIFRKVIREPDNLKVWAGILNDKRVEGDFEIAAETFQQMGLLMNIVLDYMLEIEDYKYSKHCIILSQTYFAIENAQKTFLQNLIQKHRIWDDDRVWEIIVMDSTNEELSNYAANCIDHDDTIEEDLPEKLKGIFCNQILAYAHIMTCFDVPTERIKRLIAYFQENYDLCNDLIELFDSIQDNPN